MHINYSCYLLVVGKVFFFVFHLSFFYFHIKKLGIEKSSYPINLSLLQIRSVMLSSFRNKHHYHFHFFFKSAM